MNNELDPTEAPESNSKRSLKWAIGSLAVAATGGYVFAEVNPLLGLSIGISSFSLAYKSHSIDISRDS